VILNKVHIFIETTFDSFNNFDTKTKNKPIERCAEIKLVIIWTILPIDNF